MFTEQIELAKKYRLETGKTTGAVIIFEHKAVAWVEAVENPRHWETGCYAVSVNNDVYKAVGGTPELGANSWILFFASTLTPAVYAKSRGLKSLTLMSLVSGESATNLQNWFKQKPKLFECILIAALKAQTEQTVIKATKSKLPG